MGEDDGICIWKSAPSDFWWDVGRAPGTREVPAAGDPPAPAQRACVMRDVPWERGLGMDSISGCRLAGEFAGAGGTPETGKPGAGQDLRGRSRASEGGVLGVRGHSRGGQG